MKRLILILFLYTMVLGSFCTPYGTTHPADSRQKIDSMETEVAYLQGEVKEMKKQNTYLRQDLAEQKEKNARNSSLILKQKDTLNAFYKGMTVIKDEQKKQSDILFQNQQSIMLLKKELGAIRKWTLILQIATLACLLLLAGWFFYTSRRKADSTLRQLQQSQDRIAEQIGRCNMMLNAMPKPSSGEEPLELQESAVKDHSLVIKIADEVARIENNLVRMDASVKGYRQISKSVERIKGNLHAYGYEIVDMLGKPYDDGMKVIADFVHDETLAQGEQVITSIIKPQINYNGEMIQSSQITVSQNI